MARTPNASGAGLRLRRWLYIGLAGFLMYVFVFGDYGLYNYVRLLRVRNRIVREIEELQRQKRQLTEDLERLRRDRAFLEKVAREKYRLGKPNEKIYVVRKKKKH